MTVTLTWRDQLHTICPQCGTRYTFDEYLAMEKIKMVDDDVDPKKNYGYTSRCGCGYRAFRDTPIQKAKGEILHHITSLHWLVNKLSGGRLAKPHLVDVELSTVFLEIAHDTGRTEPTWYESMFFARRAGERTLKTLPIPEGYQDLPIEERIKVPLTEWTTGKANVEAYVQRRYRTESEASSGHAELTKLLREGRYLITYSLEKIDYGDPESQYRFTWRLDFDEGYSRLLHGATFKSDWAGTAEEWRTQSGGK